MIFKIYILSDELAVDKKSSFEMRMLRWRNTFELILNKPFGVGISNYSFAYQSYSREHGKDFETSLQWLPKSPHNGFLHIASELGITALVFFTFFLLFFYISF